MEGERGREKASWIFLWKKKRAADEELEDEEWKRE